MNPCPLFWKLFREGMRAVLKTQPGFTGRIVITAHCKNGVIETVAFDTPNTPRRLDDLIQA